MATTTPPAPPRDLAAAARILAAMLLLGGSMSASSGFLRPLGVTGFIVSALWLAALAVLLCVRGLRVRGAA